MGLEYVDLEGGIQKIFKKIRDNEEDPKLDEEGNKVEILSEMEQRVMQHLKEGKSVDKLDMLEMLNDKFTDNQTLIRGFVLDLPLETADGEYWLQQLTLNKLKIRKFKNRAFSNIIELVNSEQAVLQHVQSIYESPENFRLFSLYDREMLKRPKPKKEGEEEAAEDDENAQKPVEVDQLVKRVNESAKPNQQHFQKIRDYIQF